MEVGKTLYLTDRRQWRHWLEDNFQKEKEIWLVFPNKSSGKKRLGYNDAVEEALCFGWIDSIIKKNDPESSVQRFTPRNPKSGFSQPNRERIKWLLQEGLVHPSLQDKLKKMAGEEFHYPNDILNMIKKDQAAWENFKRFSEPYKRIRIAYIASARKHPDIFKKRLSNFLDKTRKGKLVKGHGGIEKYYR